MAINDLSPEGVAWGSRFIYTAQHITITWLTDSRYSCQVAPLIFFWGSMLMWWQRRWSQEWRGWNRIPMTTKIHSVQNTETHYTQMLKTYGVCAAYEKCLVLLHLSLHLLRPHSQATPIPLFDLYAERRECPGGQIACDVCYKQILILNFSLCIHGIAIKHSTHACTSVSQTLPLFSVQHWEVGMSLETMLHLLLLVTSVWSYHSYSPI